MQCDAFYGKIQDLLEDIYQKAGSRQLEQKDYFREIDTRLEENAPFIAEATADWTAEDWKNLFYCYIKNGNLEIDRFVGERLNALCGSAFLAAQIRDHAGLLSDDVYSAGDKTSLYGSDVLFASVKLLNRMQTDGADAEVLAAFSSCAAVNEHILYELAEYLSRGCPACVSEFIQDETLEEDKLIAVLSTFVSQKRRDDTIFRAMKQRFRQMPDDNQTKPVFAAIFGDYGEPNAILPLRRYLRNLIEAYTQNRDQELFSRIMMVSSVVEGLGGSTEDLLS